MCATSRRGLGPIAWLSIREQAITEEERMELDYELVLWQWQRDDCAMIVEIFNLIK